MDAAAFQRELRVRQQASLLLARRQWRRLGSLDRWADISGRLALMVSAGQVGAALLAEEYVAGTDVAAAGAVNPRAFGGVASDGRSLETLLYSTVVHAREASPKLAEQMAAGERWLELLVKTQVADAGRAAVGVAITARPTLGYYRHVSPPCCQRCAVLAGKWLKWSEGFQRHPKCDCVHVPAGKGNPPEGYVHEVPPDQIRDLTQAQRDAISEGSNVNRVINAYRSGHPGQHLDSILQAKNGRLTPDGIYRLSSSREQAVELLKKHGYLT